MTALLILRFYVLLYRHGDRAVRITANARFCDQHVFIFVRTHISITTHAKSQNVLGCGSVLF